MVFSSSNRLYIDSQEEIIEFDVHVVPVNNRVIYVSFGLNWVTFVWTYEPFVEFPVDSQALTIY